MSANQTLPAVRPSSVPLPEIARMRSRLEAPSPTGYARTPLLIGLAIVLVAFVGSLGWAAIAPLASAAIAPGQVIVNSNRKVIQHLEGGIIQELPVRDGAQVKAGDPLVVLDDTQSGAMLEIVRGQYLNAKAREMRLIAERDGGDSIDFSDPVFSDQDIRGRRRAMEGQKSVFQARREAIQSQVDINNQRIAQLQDQIKGFEAQAEAAEKQNMLIQEEHKVVKELYEQGYEKKPRLLALERAMAEISGDRGEYLAKIAQARQQIGETKMAILDVSTKFMNEVVTELGQVQVEVADLEERLRALSDRSQRTVVRAPLDGTVVNMRFHTIGGVVPPGGEIMDLVPIGDDLVVEAMVSPQDIDTVHAGLPAEIRISAFHARTAPTLDGHVETISADSLQDKRTGQSYYLARVRIDEDSMGLLEDRKLYPGMQAEVMIKTGSRTALDIIISPITDSMNRAFREE